MKILKVTREHLSAHELAVIESKKFTIERIDMVRDLFVFCCYTGLAYVDVIKLTPDNIVEMDKGEFWVRTFRQKTEAPVNMPLLPKAMEIIRKYEGNIRSEASGTIFPVISNQKVMHTSRKSRTCAVLKRISPSI